MQTKKEEKEKSVKGKRLRRDEKNTLFIKILNKLVGKSSHDPVMQREVVGVVSTMIATELIHFS